MSRSTNEVHANDARHPGAPDTESLPDTDGLDRARGALLGLACGDAVGGTQEFVPRSMLVPIDDMVGGGPWGLKPGEWTDDTSMALCLAESFLECGGFDPRDQMERYVRWMLDGHLSSKGHCFDIGTTTIHALQRFMESGEPWAGSTDPMSAGNGSIMRLAPVVLFYHPDVQAVDDYAAGSSLTTHAADEAVATCRILAGWLSALLAGASKDEALAAVEPAPWMSPRLEEIVEGCWIEYDAPEIVSSGYCVDTLEAAMWCFWHAQSFEDAILTAANLGDDADTVAAVAGQLAGAHWGAQSIPSGWLDKLVMADLIRQMAERLWASEAEAAGPESAGHESTEPGAAGKAS